MDELLNFADLGHLMKVLNGGVSLKPEEYEAMLKKYDSVKGRGLTEDGLVEYFTSLPGR